MTPVATVPKAPSYDWLVSNFVDEVGGAEHAVVVASDGLLLAASRGFPQEHAEQLSAIVSGLQSLAEGVARMFAKGDTDQLILRMGSGHLLVMAVSDGSRIAVMTTHRADLKVVAYRMTLLVDEAGHVLTAQARGAGAGGGV